MVKYNMQNKPANVLIIESGEGRGGSSVCLYEMLKIIDKKEFMPIVAYYHEGEDIRKIKELGIEVISLSDYTSNRSSSANIKTRVNLYAFSKLKQYKFIKATLLFRDFLRNLPLILYLLKIIKKRGISLVHLNNDLITNLPGLIATRLARVPCLAYMRAICIPARSKLFSKLADACIAISDNVEKSYIKVGMPPDKIWRIYDGIDTIKFNPSINGNEIREEFGIPPSAIIVTSVGRLVIGKGQSELIHAASEVVKKHPEVIFLIVGDGSPEENTTASLYQEVLNLGLQKQVIFTGWRTDIPKILGATDIFVQNSSIPEGLGVASLEAISMGKPTIVTNIGGLSEVVEHGVSGLVIPPNDPESLSHAILELIENKDLKIKFGQNGRKKVEENFGIGKTVKKLETLYKLLLNKRFGGNKCRD